MFFLGIIALNIVFFLSFFLFRMHSLSRSTRWESLSTFRTTFPVCFTSVLKIDQSTLSPPTDPSEHVADAGSGILNLSHAGWGDFGKTALAPLASYPGPGAADQSGGTDQSSTWPDRSVESPAIPKEILDIISERHLVEANAETYLSWYFFCDGLISGQFHGCLATLRSRFSSLENFHLIVLCGDQSEECQAGVGHYDC